MLFRSLEESLNLLCELGYWLWEKLNISDVRTHQANNDRERLRARLLCESTGELIRTDFDFLHGRLAISGVSRILLLVLIGVDVIALATFLTIGPSLESNGHMGLRHESLLPGVNGNPTSQQISLNNNKAIFPSRGFEKILG